MGGTGNSTTAWSSASSAFAVKSASLLRLLNDQLHPGLFKGFYLCHPCVWVLEFYPHLYIQLYIHFCDAFGLGPKGGN